MLSTPHVGVTIWVEHPETGVWGNHLVASTVTTANTLYVDSDVPVNVKVVVQPGILEEASFQQDTQNRVTSLEDRLDFLAHGVDTINEVVAEGALDHYDYESVAPKLVHVVPHQMNDVLVDPTIWVQEDDNEWYIHTTKVRSVDSNTIEITLTTAANARCRISRR